MEITFERKEILPQNIEVPGPTDLVGLDDGMGYDMDALDLLFMSSHVIQPEGKQKEEKKHEKISKYQIFYQRLWNLGYEPNNFSLRQMAAQSFCMPEDCEDVALIRTADFLSPLKTRPKEPKPVTREIKVQRDFNLANYPYGKICGWPGNYWLKLIQDVKAPKINDMIEQSRGLLKQAEPVEKDIAQQEEKLRDLRQQKSVSKKELQECEEQLAETKHRLYELHKPVALNRAMIWKKWPESIYSISYTFEGRDSLRSNGLTNRKLNGAYWIEDMTYEDILQRAQEYVQLCNDCWKSTGTDSREWCIRELTPVFVHNKDWNCLVSVKGG